MAPPTQPARPPFRVGRKTLLLALYLLLLVVSHLVRLATPPPEPYPGDSVIEVQAVEGDKRTAQKIRLAYRDEPGPDPDAPVVLLLQGSPGSKRDFTGIAPILRERYRVIAPDLPGFGRSSPSCPDYSTRAHAGYVLQLLERLDAGPVHVVGFSMGGGVALRLYDRAPERVRSLVLLSAIGVQELELLGDYHLNHLVHGLQLGLLWLGHEATPHMGWLDGSMLSVAYARNFYDTDQRPLRHILGNLEPPLLILHGERDFLVPPEAAREHHRIVPQSELLMLDDDHFMVFMDPRPTAERIEDFFASVDAGSTPTRAEADPARVARAEEPFDPRSIPAATGFALVILVVLIASATLISEDLTCIGVGLLVAQGRIDFWPGTLACFAGIFFGDMVLFLAGRYLGRPAIARAPFRWLLSEERVETASRWFSENGPIVIGICRFLPGARLPTYFAAGTLRTSFVAFSFYFFVAVAVWTPILVWISMLLGERAFGYFEAFKRHSGLALLLLGLWMLIMMRLVLPMFSFRGRRLLVSKLKRIARWEFWPPWVFYPPVVAWIGWLGLRYRDPLLFTAANPAMPAGGFISEPKDEIYEGLRGAGEWIARTRLLRGSDSVAERVESAREFLADERLDYPVVVKPNAGQRGSGVAIVHSELTLVDYLESMPLDTLVQEYVPGDEFGVFYYRYPEDDRGRILSVTEKRLPVVTGDGNQTVEELILNDPRAVCMAQLYLERQSHQMFRVPAAGEQIRLVELGTHCRGAIFLDGSWVLTEALTDTIDAISKQYDGFFFGRYDLRTTDVERLKRGEGFKVIELNGVTSEATHIYDPGTGLLTAYRTLFEQWRIAFEIGRQNHDRGHPPASLADLVGMLVDYRRDARSHPE